MKSYLDGCQKIEQLMAEIYRKLAGVEDYSEKLRSIFAQMARDEDDHARQLELAKGVPETAFAKDRRFDQRKLEDLRRQAHRLLRLAAGPAPIESLMLETAKDLEMEFIKIHLQNALKFRDAAMAETFRSMAREDQEHFETLDAYHENT
jgi:rubrerythrin